MIREALTAVDNLALKEDDHQSVRKAETDRRGLRPDARIRETVARQSPPQTDLTNSYIIIKTIGVALGTELAALK